MNPIVARIAALSIVLVWLLDPVVQSYLWSG